MRFVGVPLAAGFPLDAPAMLGCDRARAAGAVYLAYPNNPTGNLFAAREVEAIIRAAPGLVVVDEAYYAFADASFLPRLAEFANLLVLRTMSKVGMAGMRLGYAVAAPEWIAEFNKVRQPYNVNALTQAAVGRAARGHGVDRRAGARRSGPSAGGLPPRLAALPGVDGVSVAGEFRRGARCRCDAMVRGA